MTLDIRHNGTELNVASVVHKISKWLKDLNLLIKPKRKLSFSGLISLQSLNLQIKTPLTKKTNFGVVGSSYRRCFKAKH